MEGEPVGRQYGQYKKSLQEKYLFCIFLVNKINGATLAHFFTLHKIEIEYYGGKAKIIPIEIEDFIKLLIWAEKKRPKSIWLKDFLMERSKSALKVKNEIEWMAEIKESIRKYS
jgi:hypothetical protein